MVSHSGNLLPIPDVVVDQVESTENGFVVICHSSASEARCPTCGGGSSHIHSYRLRTLQDLPVSGYAVKLQLRARRFRCSNATCARRTFTERFERLTTAWARRTHRLTQALKKIGLALGGEAGKRVAHHLAMSTSGDTLIRILRTEKPAVVVSPQLGVDDWAIRRGQSYGTLLVNLENHRPIELLPDRTAAPLTAWLRAHPEIEVITRDRSTEYARAIRAGAPQATQVADRWHLLNNLKEALERMFHRIRAEVESLPETDDIRRNRQWFADERSGRRSVKDETRKRRLHERRRARFDQVRALQRQGWSIQRIARHLKVSWATVRRLYHLERFPAASLRRHQASQLDPYAPYLQARWAAGCHNAQQLWREICAQGYTGSHRMVTLWAQLRRTPTEKAVGRPLRPTPFGETRGRQRQLPTAGRLAWLLLRQPEARGEDATTLVSHLMQSPTVSTAYALSQQFATMLRDRQSEALHTWLEAAEGSKVHELSTFAAGLRKDLEAITAAFRLKWSNGPVEGHITRLKLIKRQMYGRAKLDLLRIRVLSAV